MNKKKQVKFITIKDTDFGEIRVEKSLIDFLNEKPKLTKPDSYSLEIIDFGTK